MSFPINPRRLDNHPIVRAATAAFLEKGRPGVTRAEIAARMWPKDIATQRVVARGAVDALNTGDNEALLASSMSSFFSNLPNSAVSQMLTQGMVMDLGDFSQITLPYRSDAPTAAPFIAEEKAIPIRTGALGAELFGPLKKAAYIFVVSREVARTPGAEGIFRKVMLEDAAQTLDAAVFSTAAANDERPAGILNGATPITGYSGGDEGAMRKDIRALAAAVTDAGGDTVAFVMNPKRVARLRLLQPDFAFPVWPSRAVAEGRIIGVDPTAFACAFGDHVSIDTSTVATLHMSSTATELVSDAGAVADPIRSKFQTDSVATRMIVWLTFAMRGARAQFVEATTW
jgi:hypothetical protein